MIDMKKDILRIATRNVLLSVANAENEPRAVRSKILSQSQNEKIKKELRQKNPKSKKKSK